VQNYTCKSFNTECSTETKLYL